MTCSKCKATFDAAQKAQISVREFDELLVETKCPSCGRGYFSKVAIWFVNRRQDGATPLEAGK